TRMAEFIIGAESPSDEYDPAVQATRKTKRMNTSPAQRKIAVTIMPVRLKRNVGSAYSSFQRIGSLRMRGRPRCQSVAATDRRRPREANFREYGRNRSATQMMQTAATTPWNRA